MAMIINKKNSKGWKFTRIFLILSTYFSIWIESKRVRLFNPFSCMNFIVLAPNENLSVSYLLVGEKLYEENVSNSFFTLSLNLIIHDYIILNFYKNEILIQIILLTKIN